MPRATKDTPEAKLMAFNLEILAGQQWNISHGKSANPVVEGGPRCAPGSNK